MSTGIDSVRPMTSIVSKNCTLLPHASHVLGFTSVVPQRVSMA